MRLFQPGRIGTLEIPNRLVMPPMGTMLANPDGTVSQHLLNYYGRRAQGGVGMVVVEIAAVDPVQIVSPTQIRINDDKYIPGLAALARAIKGPGARAAIQIHHPGRQTSARVTGVQPVAPSPIPCPLLREEPRAMTLEEIRQTVENFAQGARRAREAGFDAIELHGAHGYLLCQFLSPFSNKRTDIYGGDTKNRARLALEVLEAVRRAVGRDFPVYIRISAREYVEGGITLEEGIALARLLEQGGADAISVSAGNYGALEWAIQPVLLPRGCLVPLAQAVKKAVRVPVITAGRLNDPRLGEKILEEGKADFIAVGRPLLADPDLPRKAREGKFAQINQCIACNSCQDSVFRRGPILCLVNPETGHEGEVEGKADQSRKVLVLGGGPAGLEAARVAAQRGHQVTLWERNPALEGRWSWLISPYVKLQLSRLKKLGVKVELDKKATPSGVKAFAPQAVIATPPVTALLPAIPGLPKSRLLLADDVVEGLAEVKGKAVVLGGGNIGCEAAQYLVRRGVEVTILEKSPRLAYGLEWNFRQVLQADLKKRGVVTITRAEPVRAEGKELIYRLEGGQEGRVEADAVVVALGSQPDPRGLEKLKGPWELFPVSYCDSPQATYKTSQEGAQVARKI